VFVVVGFFNKLPCKFDAIVQFNKGFVNDVRSKKNTKSSFIVLNPNIFIWQNRFKVLTHKCGTQREKVFRKLLISILIHKMSQFAVIFAMFMCECVCEKERE